MIHFFHQSKEAHLPLPLHTHTLMPHPPYKEHNSHLSTAGSLVGSSGPCTEDAGREEVVGGGAGWTACGDLRGGARRIGGSCSGV